MALTNMALPKFVITMRNEEFNRSIVHRSAALGTNLADEYHQQMILLVRDVVFITPPYAGPQRGGLQSGQSAINRDLFAMGFVPVTIKGFRMITRVPAGRTGKFVPIAPVRVPTKLNPAFEDPDAFHAARIRHKSEAGRRRVSRGATGRRGGGARAFYVSKTKFQAMRTRLFKEIGTLAAAWLPGLRAINSGALPGWAPAWIKRHEADAGGRYHVSFNFDPKKGAMYIDLTNSMPDTAGPEAAATQQRVEQAKQYRINAIRRGLQGRAERIARKGRAA